GFYGCLEPFYIIKRMLPKEVFGCIAKQLITPSWVSKYRRRYFTSACINDDRTNGISPKVHSDKICFAGHSLIFQSFDYRAKIHYFFKCPPNNYYFYSGMW